MAKWKSRSRRAQVAAPPNHWSLSARIGWYTGPRDASGCREWLGCIDVRGYPRIKERQVYVRATRFLLGLQTGDPRVAMHACDNPWCVELTHLRIGDQVDNIRDMVGKGRARGTSRPGESNPAAVLNAQMVLEMRSAFANGERFCDIARRYGVRQHTARLAIIGETWKATGGWMRLKLKTQPSCK